jgi:integrase/ribosomal protein L40E
MVDYEKVLAREISRIGERGLPKEIVDRLLEYLDFLSITGNNGKGLSPGRKYAYFVRLRKVASMIPDEFLNPSEKDLTKVVSKLGQSKVKWGNSEEHERTASSMQAYLVAIKKFYKWHLGKNKAYPECVEFIKTGNVHPAYEDRPEALITQDEVDRLIHACTNKRDAALFATMYDSGARLGELFSLRIQDVTFDDYGALLSVKGKTGHRNIRVIGNSIPYLREWIEVHPNKSDEESPLFCNLSEDIKGRKMTHEDVYSVIRHVTKRAGIERRIHPHLFRHTRATILAANNLAEAPLEDQMGWVHGSKQTRTYVHLSGRDQDNAVLRSYGIQVKEEDKRVRENAPAVCPRCKQKNPSSASFCHRCGSPMDLNKLKQFEENQRKIEESLRKRSDISQEMQTLLGNIKNIPESEKTAMLSAIIKTLLDLKKGNSEVT